MFLFLNFYVCENFGPLGGNCDIICIIYFVLSVKCSDLSVFSHYKSLEKGICRKVVNKLQAGQNNGLTVQRIHNTFLLHGCFYYVGISTLPVGRLVLWCTLVCMLVPSTDTQT